MSFEEEMMKINMMIQCMAVGAGGAIGAVFRYLLSLIRVGSDFPLMTFLTNVAGAVAIGVIAAFAERFAGISPCALLFLKTGICGGFTTFSTFSLETLTLIQKNHMVTACAYAGASLIFCLAGVWLGGQMVKRWI